MPVSDTYLVEIKMFETFVIGTVEHNHYNHNLSLRHTAVSVIIPLSVITRLRESSATEHGFKNFAEFISHYEYFCNFVFVSIAAATVTV